MNSERDDHERGYVDGCEDSLVWAHAITAHMLDCPEARKSDIVSQTPEYKIGYVEALVNVMTAIDRRLTEIKNKSHDHHHLQSETESQSHDQQSDATATTVEPTSQS